MKKLLLIEDDFYIRGLYKTAFQKKGYEVTEAEDGQSALEKIQEDNFDFIVLDLMLPRMPGLKVLRAIRAENDTPIYVLTNVGSDEILKEAIAEGAEGYFLKVDYTPSQLVAAIEQKIEEGRSRQ